MHHEREHLRCIIWCWCAHHTNLMCCPPALSRPAPSPSSVEQRVLSVLGGVLGHTHTFIRESSIIKWANKRRDTVDQVQLPWQSLAWPACVGSKQAIEPCTFHLGAALLVLETFHRSFETNLILDSLNTFIRAYCLLKNVVAVLKLLTKLLSWATSFTV